jgi:hypothetical protein
MTTAIPPAAPPPAPAQTVAQAALTVVSAAAPDKLAALPQGALLNAVVNAAATQGVIKLVTEAGAITLKVPPNLQLPPDSQLMLQLTTQNGNAAFKLLAINGRPVVPAGGPVSPLLQPAGTAAALMAALQPGLAGGPLPLATGTAGAATPTLSGDTPGVLMPAQQQGPGGLVATVLRPAGGPAAQTAAPLPGQPPLPAGLADLTPGTTLTLRIAAVAPPGEPLPASVPAQSVAPTAPSGTGQPTAAQPAASGPTIPSPQATPTTAAASPSATPPGAAASSLPPLAGPPAAAPTVPVQLTGEVVAHPAGGNTIVRTPAGLLSLPTATALPPGSAISFEVVGRPVPPAVLQPGLGAPAGLGPQGWPALTEAANALASADPQTFEQAMRGFPQMGPRLATGLALFSGALRSGELRQVLNDGAMRGLERAGRRDVADRLRKEMGELSADSGRPVGGGEWRVYTMPLMMGAEIDPIRLYVRRPPGEVDEDGEGGSRKGQEQRFILEVGMTRLGRVQLDGLVTRESKRFDLIVRTYDPLPDEMRRDIGGIFAECGQLTGTKGTVAFQAGRFVDLPPADAPGTRITV